MATPITYTTTREIKSFAGLLENNFLKDEFVDGHRTRAKGRINTVLASRYALPLPTSGIEDIKQYLSQIELYIAWGNLLWQEYGQEAIGTDKDGPEKIRMWEAMLKDLLEGKVKLIKDDGTELDSAPSTESSSSIPLGDDNSPAPAFTRDLSDI